MATISRIVLSLFCLTIPLLQRTNTETPGTDCPVLDETQQPCFNVSRDVVNYTGLGSDRAPWSYKGNDGPDTWSKGYPSCGGKKQSPISFDGIETQSAKLEAIEFHRYNVERSGMRLINRGYAVELYLAENEKDPPYIQLTKSGMKYTLGHVHFHWGENDTIGAEHVVDPNYGRSLEANDCFNEVYNPITTALLKIRAMNTQVIIKEKVSLDSLLPELRYRNFFFRYNGSFTIPPCHQDVIWNVYKYPSSIGIYQMSLFRNLLRTPPGKDEESLTPNYRQVQPLNGRKVYKVEVTK